jgi:hypothetical protein
MASSGGRHRKQLYTGERLVITGFGIRNQGQLPSSAFGEDVTGPYCETQNAASIVGTLLHTVSGCDIKHGSTRDVSVAERLSLTTRTDVQLILLAVQVLAPQPATNQKAFA